MLNDNIIDILCKKYAVKINFTYFFVLFAIVARKSKVSHVAFMILNSVILEYFGEECGICRYIWPTI